MPNGSDTKSTGVSKGIDMDTFNESMGNTGGNKTPSKATAVSTTQKPKGVEKGIDLDAFNESLKKKEDTNPSSQLSPDGGKNTSLGTLPSSVKPDNTPAPQPTLPSKDETIKGMGSIINDWMPKVVNGANPNSIADFSSPLTEKTNVKTGLNEKQVSDNRNRDASVLLHGVQSGDPSQVNRFRNKIGANIDAQINVLTKSIQDMRPGRYAGADVITKQQSIQKQISDLQDKKTSINSTIDNYIDLALVGKAQDKNGGLLYKDDIIGIGRDKTKSATAGIYKNAYFTPDGKESSYKGFLDYASGKVKRSDENIVTHQDPTAQTYQNFMDYTNGLGSILKASGMDYKDYTDKYSKTNDPKFKDLADKAKSQYNTATDKLKDAPNEFLPVQVDYVARVMGDEISDMHPVMNVFITDSDRKEAVDRLDKKYPGFSDKYSNAIKFIDDNGGIESQIPHQGFIGALNRGGVEAEKSLVNSAQDLAGGTESDRNDENIKDQFNSYLSGTSKSGESPTKIQVDNDGLVFKEAKNENYNKFDLNNVLNTSGRFIGGIVPYAATAELGGDFVGGLAGAEDVTTGATQTAKTITGNVASGYLNQYDGNLKIADQLISDKSGEGDVKKQTVANLLTLGQAAAFSILPVNQYIRGNFSSSVAKDALEYLSEIGPDGITKSDVQKFLSEKVIPRIKPFAKINAEMLALNHGNALIESMFDETGATKNKNLAEEDINTLKDATIGTLFLEGIGGTYRRLSEKLPMTTRDALFDVANNPDENVARINQMVTDGKMDQKKATGLIKIINTSKEILPEVLGQKNEKGLPFSTKQYKEMLADKIRKSISDNYIKEGVSKDDFEKASTNADSDIKDNISTVTQDPIHEHPLLKELGIKSPNDIDVTKDYEVSKVHVPESLKDKTTDIEGTENVKINGADLLRELPNLEIPDTQILPVLDKAKEIVPADQLTHADNVLQKVNNAEKINVNDIEKAQNELYQAWDDHPDARHLIEPLISKLQTYPDEFKTETQTRTVTEKEPVGGSEQTQRTVSKSLDQWEGNNATITNADGTESKGQLRSEEGKYYLYNSEGEKVASLGEKAITDRDVTLPPKEDYPSPITIGEDGNVKSITLQLNKVDMEHGGTNADKLITIDFKDPEKALDYAIQLRAEQVGSVPDAAFDNAYQEVEKEVQEEVPVKVSSKTNTNGNEKEGDKENRQKNADEEGRNAQKIGETGNGVGDTSNPSETGAATGKDGAPVISHEVKYNDETKKFDVVSNKGTVMGSFDTHKEALDRSGALNEAMAELDEPKKKEEGKEPNAEKNIPENIVGIKNSIANENRVHRGLLPLMKEAKRKMGQVWDNVKKDVASGNINPNNLVDETYAKAMFGGSKEGLPIFNDYQNAQLLFHRIDVTNRIKTGEDILDNLSNATTPEEISNAFDKSAEWIFKSDTDKNKFKNLISDPEATPDIIKKALEDIINDFHFDLHKNDIVAEKTGTAWGQSGKFRQMLVSLQGEVVNWTKQLERQMGAHVDSDTIKTVSALEKEYKDTIEKLKESHSKELEDAADKAYKKAVSFVKDSSTKKEGAQKSDVEKTLKQKGNDIADKILRLKIKTDPNVLQASVIGLPVAAYNALIDGVSLAVRAGATIADAIEDMLKKDDYKGLKKEDVINHLMGGFSLEEKKSSAIDAIRDSAAKNNETSISKNNVGDIKKLMSLHIQDGASSLSDLLSRTKEDIKDILPDATEEDIRDALSGRGVKQDTKITMQSDLSKLKNQATNVGKYIDLLNVPEDETDAQRLKRISKLNDLYNGTDGNGIKDEIQRMGIVPPNDQLRLKDINDKRILNTKDKVKSIIDGLKKEVPVSDAQKQLFDNEQKVLSSKLRDVGEGRLSQDQRFARANNIISDQISNYEKDREKMTSLFRKDKPEKGTPEYQAEKEKVDAINDRIKQLKDAKNSLDIDNKLVSIDRDNAVVAAKAKDAINRSISKLQSDIDEGNYEEDAPARTGIEDVMSRPDPKRTADIRDLEKKKNLLELKRRDAVDRYNDSKKGVAAKTANSIVRSKRMLVLVKGAILAKLGAAVAWGQTVFAPMNSLAGAFWNKAGDFLSGTMGWNKDTRHLTTWGKFLNKSLRYGRVHGMAELEAYGRTWSYDNLKKGKGFIGFTKDTAKKIDGFKSESTLKSFASDFKNGYSELGLLFGHDVNTDEFYANMSDEARFHQKAFWGAIGGGLDLAKRIGTAVRQVGEYGVRSHGAIKGVAKGMEFARSYFTIKENAKAVHGEAWTEEPVNQMQMGMLAYQESVRGILMENNKISDMYQKAIQSMRKGDGPGNALGLAITGELLPVAKVPTNIALQAGRAVLGLPGAGGEIALRLIAEKLNGSKITKILGNGDFIRKNGIDNMSDQRASALLRNLRNGTVGAFMITGMILGASAASNYYFKHNPSQEEEDNKLQEGEIKIGDVTVDKDLADHPNFVAMKMGETYLRAYQYYHEDDGDAAMSAMSQALLRTGAGLIKESPLAGEPSDAMKAIEGQQNMGWFWNNLVVSSVYPSEMKEIATWTDKSNGTLIPYKGTVIKRLTPDIWSTFKAWTPGVRQTLPTP